MKKIISLLLIIIIFTSIFSCVYADDYNNYTLKIDYLDVEEGDAAFISCCGYNLLIDGGSPEYSDYIYSYLKKNEIKRIDYVIATHPDADHIGGLSGALNYSTVGTVFCTKTEHDTDSFSSFIKYLEKQNNRIIIPNAGDVFTLGNATVSILSPKLYASRFENTSIIVKVQFGETSFLFMGDSEKEDEQLLLNSGVDLKSDVLKVGHHGSSSSTTAEFIKKVSPSYAVISVGENNYGHPSDDVLYRLNKNNIDIYRTDQCGIITCTSDGNIITFDFEKQNPSSDVSTRSQISNPADAGESTRIVNNSDNQSAESEKADTAYIVNKNTGKFHYPGCSSVKKMKESNKWYYSGTRDELISSGYSPCGNCHP